MEELHYETNMVESAWAFNWNQQAVQWSNESNIQKCKNYRNTTSEAN